MVFIRKTFSFYTVLFFKEVPLSEMFASGGIRGKYGAQHNHLSTVEMLREEVSPQFPLHTFMEGPCGRLPYSQ